MTRATRDAPPEGASSSIVGLATVPADRYRGGYSSLQLRADLTASYRAAYRHVHALGGVLTSSGGIRDLREKATAGRSKTSLHYTGRALDLFIYSGMQGGNEPMLVTRAGGTDVNPEWKLYCVSATPMPESPLYDTAWIAERDVECARWVKNVGYATFERRATCFCLTDVMARYGWEPIPARRTWRAEYTACEWWHFQNAQGLTLGVSTFGEQLLQVWPDEDVRASGLSLGAVWAGRSFRVGVSPPASAHPMSTLEDPPEKIVWAQTVLNAVAGSALSADGKFGAKSKAALRQFQADKSIPTTGTLDATTEVALLQGALERLDGARVARVGVLDEATVHAITDFQRKHALLADGRAGPRTRAAMVTEFAMTPRPRIRRHGNSADGSSTPARRRPRRKKGTK